MLRANGWIEGFKLKPWAQQFLLVRGYRCEAIGSIVPPAGIGALSVPESVAILLSQPFRDPYASKQGLKQRGHEMRELLREGLTKSAIARLYGISPRRVGQVLMEAQVPAAAGEEGVAAVKDIRLRGSTR